MVALCSVYIRGWETDMRKIRYEKMSPVQTGKGNFTSCETLGVRVDSPSGLYPRQYHVLLFIVNKVTAERKDCRGHWRTWPTFQCKKQLHQYTCILAVFHKTCIIMTECNTHCMLASMHTHTNLTHTHTHLLSLVYFSSDQHPSVGL